MKICTINIPDAYLDCLKVLCDRGDFPSRSEAVRQALLKFLAKEAVLNADLDPREFQVLKDLQLNQINAMGIMNKVDD